MTLEIAMEIMEDWNSDGMNSVDNIDKFVVEVAEVLYKALLDAPKNTIHNSYYTKCLECNEWRTKLSSTRNAL